MHHQPRTSWRFNGNLDLPTFQPSILVNTTVFTEEGQAEYDKWYADGYPPREGRAFASKPLVCHSYVTDGRIQFLPDSTHSLSGQTVDLPELE